MAPYDHLASGPRMYGEMASWWPLISAPADYEVEAAYFLRTIRELARGDVRSILELGSGGGSNAYHLKAHAELVLVDRAPGMLDVSRRLNPECEHVAGDMRSVRLNRTFDAVFVHDAVMYMTSGEDLQRLFATAFLHCRSGGVALFAPDVVRETFRPGTQFGGHDGADRSIRYIEWTTDPDPVDDTYQVDFIFASRIGAGELTIQEDRHHLGLFRRAEWLRWIGDAGFVARRITEPRIAGMDPGEVFVGFRP